MIIHEESCSGVSPKIPLQPEIFCGKASITLKGKIVGTGKVRKMSLPSTRSIQPLDRSQEVKSAIPPLNLLNPEFLKQELENSKSNNFTRNLEEQTNDVFSQPLQNSTTIKSKRWDIKSLILQIKKLLSKLL